MRFSLQVEPRPEHRLRTVSIDEIVSLISQEEKHSPLLENYFSPTKKEAFIKDFLHYLNTGLLEAKHGELNSDKYLVFILSFQFTAPLLEISAEKELGLFKDLPSKESARTVYRPLFRSVMVTLLVPCSHEIRLP